MQKININTDFITYFNCGSVQLRSEAEILGSIITTIIADKKTVTNKSIIAYLLAELECTNDAAFQDCLRNTLQIVVGKTPDDESFLS
ncbi:biofilm/acid-resistance regulator YmgB/AriR (plasmid) [Enterobacter ludwigii]